MRRCHICNKIIPPERIEALPDTLTCVDHSTVTKPIGYMIPNASKGTALSLEFIPDDKEAQRIARRAHRRQR